MKIILLRHGEPEFNLFARTNKKYPAAELATIIHEYNTSALKSSNLPSQQTLDIAQACTTIVCSDLKRSLDSARLLNRHKISLIDPVFRETELPYADWIYPKLSLRSWITIFRILWFFGYANHAEHIRHSRLRVITATETLVKQAQQYGSVLLVGHGFMNYFIAKQLRSTGWHGPKNPGRNFWDYAIYQY